MDVTFLSPHRDDIAFSCSVFVLRCSLQRVRVRIVNCFTITAHAPLDPGSNGKWPEASHVRRLEDERFARCFDPALELIDLDRKDAPVRTGCPVTEVCAPVDLDMAEVDEIEDRVRELPAPDLLMIPLAIGNHRDHRIVREAGGRLRGWAALGYYEDLPYASWSPEPEVERQGYGAAAGVLPFFASAPHAQEEKNKFLNCYPSQLDRLTATNIIQYMNRYQGAERIWAPAESVASLLC